MDKPKLIGSFMKWMRNIDKQSNVDFHQWNFVERMKLESEKIACLDGIHNNISLQLRILTMAYGHCKLIQIMVFSK